VQFDVHINNIKVT